MSVASTTYLRAATEVGTHTYVQALVSNALTHEMLLSWHDLQELNIIPSNFPAVQTYNYARVNRATEEKENYLAELLASYDEVLSAELKQEPMITHSPMKIHLMRGGKPYGTATARHIPLRFEEQADKMLDELKQMGVITEVNESMACCSPAFWVPKPDNIRVRLVTDFTNLYKVVKQPIHPFPCTTKILQAILANARVFTKLDTGHVYFQLALDKKAPCSLHSCYHRENSDTSGLP